MHIPPYDNENKAIVDSDDARVPLNYFNIVNLKKGDCFSYQTPEYETSIVPATGNININCEGVNMDNIGRRSIDVWGGEPEGVYIPSGAKVEFVCMSDSAEVFIAGARYSKVLEPFAVRENDIDMVQYGSDDTKTHRKIKHILGTKYHGKVGRLLVSELYTVGTGGWSGFPSHKHDTDRGEEETRHDETYNFRFKPNDGFGLQLLQKEGDDVGNCYHVLDKSTLLIDGGYHPCVVAPGYEMYYFTILAGNNQRSLTQYFQPQYANQVETIPGIKDMVAKFK